MLFVRGDTSGLFRAANEQIEQRRAEIGFGGKTPLLCECPDERCSTIVRLSSEDYARVRAQPARYLVVPGHAEGADVVERQAGHWVIESESSRAALRRP